MKRCYLGLLAAMTVFSVYAQSKGNPSKYSTAPSNHSCQFFDGFADNRDGTVTDPRSGLIWKRCAEGMSWNGTGCSGEQIQLNLDEGLIIARASRYLGKADWRVPAKKEWADVTGNESTGCSKNADWFSSKKKEFAISKKIANVLINDKRPPPLFHSSTPVDGNPSGAWMVDLTTGNIFIGAKAGRDYINLVRGDTAESREELRGAVQKNRKEAASKAYDNLSEVRREEQARQLCEAQKQTCIASYPKDEIYKSLPDSNCKWRCEGVTCS